MYIEKPLTVTLMGHSGSGKGTQVQLLKEFLKRNDPERAAHKIETGQLARDFMAGEGHTQKLVKEALSEGKLMPSFVPVYLWGHYLINQVQPNDHWLFDGTPRKEREMHILYNAMQFYGRNNYCMIILEVSDETAAARMMGRQRGGLKDEEVATKRKIEWYHGEVEVTLASAEKIGVPVYRIDGEPAIEEVHASILHALDFDIARS